MNDNFWLKKFSTKNTKTPKWVSALEAIFVKTPFDLLWILPSKYQTIINERDILSLTELVPNQVIRIEGRVKQLYFKPLYFRKNRKVILHHAFAKIVTSKYVWTIQGFNLYPAAKEKWKNWESSESITLVGEFSTFKGNITLTNPKEESPSIETGKKEFLINYPQIKGITSHQFNKLITTSLKEHWTFIPKTPIEFNLIESFKTLHAQSNNEDNRSLAEATALNNLKTYELWCEQNLILKKREIRKKLKIEALKIINYENLFSKIPWSLTEEQLITLKETIDDLQKNYPMRRLLQGEVGSGKSIIAFLTAYALARDNNVQVAIIAPTETLARQHFDKWWEFFDKEDHTIRTMFYYASCSLKEKKTTLQALKDGTCHVVIGTHALFQNDVIYKNLRYIIIDEQHRFGVEQRKKLFSKGNSPHTLMMSATPIPRTLSLTHFGDLEQSIMTKTPFGEKKIKTRLVETEHYELYLTFIKTRLSLGEQVYVVAPVIEESEHFTFHIKFLEKFFNDNFKDYSIALLHGKLKEEEQKVNFNLFKNGTAAILIATTMIEVGIDVANATVICIYHPEQFGLSSLHQLRGRVGRNKKSGFCFLVAPYTIDEQTKERLLFFEKNLDGFVLAEKDFNLRGQGNLWGIEQSGNQSSYRIAQLPQDNELLIHAQELAEKYYPCSDIILPSHFSTHFMDENELQHWL